MSRHELSRYHDLASSTKTPGRGIGFAGVGIKLGLLVAKEVITETRRGRVHVATSWRLASRSRAPWKWIEPPGLRSTTGTAITLRLENPLSPLLDTGFLAARLMAHYQPLFEPAFDAILRETYPEGVLFLVARRQLKRMGLHSENAPVVIRVGRKRKPAGLGYLARSVDPLPEDARGIAISTLGKVIKRGWEWVGITPMDAEHVHGLIEVPALAEALALNKADFVRTGNRGALVLTYRKAIQEAVTAQLAAWGDKREADKRKPRTGPMERDLERVLGTLARDFPLLTTLVERRGGGQRRLSLGTPTDPEAANALVQQALALEPPSTDGQADESDAASASDESSTPSDQSSAPDERPQTQTREPPSAAVPGRKRKSAAGKLGVEIRFESKPESEQLGRFIESIIWVNEAHPAYQRALASRSEGYHIALTVALALAPLAVEPHATHDFVTSFLTRWGESTGGRKES